MLLLRHHCITQYLLPTLPRRALSDQQAYEHVETHGQSINHSRTQTRQKTAPTKTIPMKLYGNADTTPQRKAQAAVSNTTAFGTKAKPNRQKSHMHTVILATGLHGGIGNQIYCMLEALVLARRAGLTILSPSTIARTFSEPQASPTPFAHPGRDYWDNAHTSTQVPVINTLPESCDKQFQIYYHVHRGKVHQTISKSSISGRAKMEICFHVGTYSHEQSFAQCADWGLRDTVFESRALPISNDGDDSFVRELAGLRMGILPKGAMVQPGASVCVFVDGHSFNRGGLVMRDYLYSHMHLLQPSVRIRKLMSDLLRKHSVEIGQLAVLHLRYDESECLHNKFVTKEISEQRVCVRVLMTPREKDTVYWASISEVRDSLLRVMHKEQARMLYIAASPYAPVIIVSRLVRALESVGVKVVPAFVRDLKHDELNFVERELAVRAKVFIGDYASTWTGTVYYKRRTLGKVSHWCAGLRDVEDGPYAIRSALRPPQWFENQSDIHLPSLIASTS